MVEFGFSKSAAALNLVLIAAMFVVQHEYVTNLICAYVVIMVALMSLITLLPVKTGSKISKLLLWKPVTK